MTASYSKLKEKGLNKTEKSGNFEPKLTEDGSQELVIEVEHLYPGQADYDSNPIPEEAQEFVQELENQTPDNYEITTVVTADDTSLEEKEGFLEELYDYVQESELGIDTVALESDATEGVYEVLSELPHNVYSGNGESGIDYVNEESPEKAKVYGEPQNGHTPDATVIDLTDNKVTGPACSAYDAIMSASMVEGSPVSMQTMPEGDAGIVLYNDGFSNSHLYEDSNEFQEIAEQLGADLESDSLADIEMTEVDDVENLVDELTEVIVNE
ncbi:hypothetical protein GLU60_00810 [Nanohaloarchaea archaeon H01]|nr:hypothetical protein [Nanohaloarchaea archaeon H01]